MNDKTDNNLLGIVLAAGKGSRFGNLPKGLLPIENTTFLERIIGNMRVAGLRNITTVLGYQREEVLQSLPELKDYVINSAPERGMLSSIHTGMIKINDSHSGILLTMVDYPLIDEKTYRLLIEAHEKSPDSIITPSFKRKSGHPVLFPKSLLYELRKCPLSEGAVKVVRKNSDRRKFVDVLDSGINININSKEEYERHIGPFTEDKWK